MLLERRICTGIGKYVSVKEVLGLLWNVLLEVLLPSVGLL